MKLNYYTYTIKFNTSGKTCNICIKDIIDIYCTYQKKQSALEKTNISTSRKLYFAKASSHTSVYYLMTPTELINYRRLDKKTGTVDDLKSIIGSGSLEKVTYVHLDDKLPVIGIAPSHGGATDEDVEYYLNQVINGLIPQTEYKLNIKPINSGVAKNDIKKINMLSEAKVLLRSQSNQFSQLRSLFNNTKNTDNIEIEIRVKRVAHSKIDIKALIDPMLNVIRNDPDNKEFAEVYLRGKVNSAQETIKEIILDQTMILYDIVYPKSGNAIEDQIEEKRYLNNQVDTLANSEFSQYGNKINTIVPCPHWNKLEKSNSY